MRRVTAVLSTLELPANRARWSADHDVGRQQQTASKGKDSLPSCHPRGVDTGHSSTGLRRSPEVRQCETCQANKHGRLPGETGRQTRCAGGPWQAEAAVLAGNTPMTPPEDLARQERPPPSLEVRPAPPTPSMPPPLPNQTRIRKYETPSAGGALYGD